MKGSVFSDMIYVLLNDLVMDLQKCLERLDYILHLERFHVCFDIKYYESF